MLSNRKENLCKELFRNPFTDGRVNFTHLVQFSRRKTKDNLRFELGNHRHEVAEFFSLVILDDHSDDVAGFSRLVEPLCALRPGRAVKGEL